MFNRRAERTRKKERAEKAVVRHSRPHHSFRIRPLDFQQPLEGPKHMTIPSNSRIGRWHNTLSDNTPLHLL